MFAITQRACDSSFHFYIAGQHAGLKIATLSSRDGGLQTYDVSHGFSRLLMFLVDKITKIAGFVKICSWLFA
jgi:hypothetical protein